MEEMMEEIIKIFTAKGSDLNFWQAAVRAIILFIGAILVLKAGKRKFLGKNTAMDFILAVIIGSVLSRSINGSSTLWPSLVASLTLVLFHAFLSLIATKSKKFSDFLNGKSYILVDKGEKLKDALVKHHLDENDLKEAVRLKTHENSLEKVKQAFLETNGSISIVKNNE
jgi:uncharacterized membrane protein YcaP (DUF421 family)